MTSSISHQSYFSFIIPLSILAVSSRLDKIRFIRLEPSVILSSSSCRSSAEYNESDSSRVEAEPMMEANGVRNSCEIELRRAVLNRSDSNTKVASRAFSVSLTRSMAIAASAAQASISFCCSGVINFSTTLTPSKPTTLSRVARGIYKLSAPDSVSVDRPAIRRCSYAHAATAASALSAIGCRKVWQSPSTGLKSAYTDNRPFSSGNITMMRRPKASATRLAS